jgi:regulatory protein YycI of two-component signal transduction system YycFG
MLKSIFIVFLVFFQITFVNAARNLPTQEVKSCVEKEVSAENIKTKEIKTFPSSCKIPE